MEKQKIFSFVADVYILTLNIAIGRVKCVAVVDDEFVFPMMIHTLTLRTAHEHEHVFSFCFAWVERPKESK